MKWKELAEEQDKFKKYLKKTYPKLYKKLGVPWQEGGMISGIGVGPGWFKTLEELSVKLEKIIETLPEDKQPSAFQIKEKFGVLRFYLDISNEEMNKLIDEAENKTSKVCEYCGKENAYISDYSFWMKTLCEECHNERKGSNVKP